MKQLSSREFQGSYHRLAEPVVVTRRGKEMGRWYPVGSNEPAAPNSITVAGKKRVKNHE